MSGKSTRSTYTAVKRSLDILPAVSATHTHTHTNKQTNKHQINIFVILKVPINFLLFRPCGLCIFPNIVWVWPTLALVRSVVSHLANSLLLIKFRGATYTIGTTFTPHVKYNASHIASHTSPNFLPFQNYISWLVFITVIAILQ